MSEYKGIGAGIQSPTQLKKIENALMEAVKILNTPEVKAHKKAQDDLANFRRHIQKDLCEQFGESEDRGENVTRYTFIRGKKSVSVDVKKVERATYDKRIDLSFADV